MGVQKVSRLLQTFLYGVQSTIPLLCDLDSFGAVLDRVGSTDTHSKIHFKEKCTVLPYFIIIK